jgi:Xaa-Pro dipeptidase
MKSPTKHFPPEEFAQRMRNVHAAMKEKELDAVIVTNPENIYYLTGIAHQGYFAFSSLILVPDEPGIIVMRAMEQAILRDMAPEFELSLYSDGVPPLPEPQAAHADLSMYGNGARTPARGLQPSSMSVGVSVRGNEGPLKDFSAPVDAIVHAVEELGLTSGRVAFERTSSHLPYSVAEAFVQRLPSVQWADASDLVADCRMVQSPDELACTRKAARISDAMVMTGTAVAGSGVEKADVMASIYQVLFQRGGTYPAFVPLVRSTRTIEHEHGTWEDGRLRAKELLFLEMSGCVARYHAPVGRLVHIGRLSAGSRRIARVCQDALMAAKEALKPGVTADSVYRAWQGEVDRAGLTHYHRHHCGYMVGIGFPPSWSGGGVPRGLRRGSQLEIRSGMVFHLMSWLLRTGKGDGFLSDTVVVTEHGAEFLTNAPRDPIVR